MDQKNQGDQKIMSHIQPDLFGEFDRAQEQAEHDRQPATCPACGTIEPNAYLLRNNHGYDAARSEGPGGFPHGHHPIYRDECTAQRLVTNHIIYGTRKAIVDQLARDKQRGRELGLDVEAIEAKARQEMHEKNK